MFVRNVVFAKNKGPIIHPQPAFHAWDVIEANGDTMKHRFVARILQLATWIFLGGLCELRDDVEDPEGRICKAPGTWKSGCFWMLKNRDHLITHFGGIKQCKGFP